MENLEYILRNKKILFISHTLDNTGAPRSLLEIIKGIMENYNDIQIEVYSMCGGKLKEEYDKNNINVKYIECNLENVFLKLFSKLKGLFKLFVFLLENKYDYVLINSAANFRALLLCKFFKMKPVLYVRETDEMFNNLIFLRKLGIKFANKIIAVSNVNKEWLIKNNIKIPIKVIGNGISLDDVQLKLKDDPEKEFFDFIKHYQVIGIIGNIDERRKGFDLFIKIARKIFLWDKSYRFVLIGDFKDKSVKNKFIKILRKERLEENFYITGYTNNIFKYIKHIDHIVVPSRQESFSRVILESLVVKKSVSCFDIGGNRFLVGDNYPFIVEPFNIDKMVKNILQRHILEKNIDYNEYIEKFNIKNVTYYILRELINCD